ncbi:SMP-30/gluconolactonase/LRE family protein [Geodermatophilus sp. DSM 44513]|uniref:SMP-30/gluconolactonase/LRE family protein n=1 Tax=Geodermatophilus sp. DSM 44513 TaxID=1528104 RepID=UPI001271464C|nr:SMP-30/gluconolactonase/LRE family protein [Geodermatophilus sp. DSM 44513]WNV76341.1 SMP-30/gluconolactonase/LRE family protein [Geodermatophilus sp. DSM 44513]
MHRLRATPVPGLPPARHGEGPTWDAGRAELLWVDIAAGQVRRAAVGAGGGLTETGVHRGGDTVGAVVPAADGGWLLAADGGFTHLAADGTARVLVTLAGEGGSPDSGGTRMNDAACDPAGRFLAGTMAFDERPGAGTLYRLDLDGTVTTVLDGLTVSNGVDWSPDGRTVYLADSGPGVVHAFAYDPDTGAFSGGRVLLEFAGDDGVADGLTVDDEGCLWTALWGGGQVRRWSPDGELLAVVEVPGVTQTSSCAFAGPGRDLLVVSTSAEGLDDAARAAQPDAGRLFTARPGVTGPPARPYRGPLTEIVQH